MSAQECPEAEILYAFVEGLLDDHLDGWCRDHVSRCRSCEALIQRAHGTQQMIAAWRETEPAEDGRHVVEQGCEQVLRSLETSRSTDRLDR